MSDHHFARLKEHILGLSESRDWNVAALEWKYKWTEECDSDTCPCGYEGLANRCWLTNSKNGNTTYVGNVCVRRFVAGADTLLDGIERMRRGGRPSPSVLRHAFENGWLRSWEYDTLVRLHRKRVLREGQADNMYSLWYRLLDGLGIVGVRPFMARPVVGVQQPSGQ